MIEEIKKKIKKVPVEYGDVRIEIISVDGISYRRNTLENLAYATNLGGCIRLYDRGNWVTGNFSGRNNFNKVLQWLITNLRYMENKHNNLGNHENNYYVEEKNSNQSNILKIKKFLNSKTEELKSKDYIKSADLVFSNQKTEKYFISNYGSYIKQNFNSLGMSIKITGFSNKSYVKTIRGISDETVMKDITKDITKGIQCITKKKLKLIDPSKNITILLDPTIAGVFIHETIGHTLEADSLLINKKLYNNILANPIIGCSELTIVDNPTIEGLSGSYKYDDEGTTAKQNVMIKNGKVLSLLSDCKTALILGVTSSGNARSVSYKNVPIVRASNMFVKAGSNSVGELLNEIENGYYAKDVLYGHHYNGRFIFRPKHFFEVKDGIIRNEVLPPNITGNIMSILKTIKIGNDLKINDNGVCHKQGQRSLPISISSPSILLKGVTIEN